jgi:O-antigen/teichoic acid export membrane protein
VPSESSALSGPDVGRRVVRGGAVRVAGFAASNLFAAAGAVVALRYLGVEEFGRYGTVMALVAIVQGITEAGLSVTGTREVSLAGSADERRGLLAHVVGLRIVLTGAGVLAAVGFGLIVGYDETLVLGTLIAGTGVFLISVQAAMLIPLSVDLRNGTLTLNELIRQGLLVIGFVVLALVGAQLLAFFALQIVAGVVLLAITPWLIERRDLVTPRWTTDQLKRLAAIGLPVALASVLMAVYFRVLVVIMSLLSGDERQIGLFVTSTRIFELAAALPLILSTIVLPVMTVAARDNPTRLRYVIQETTQLFALVGVFTALVVALGAEPILRILGGEQYVAAAPLLRIQSIAILTLFVSAAWSPALIGMHKQGSVAAATGIGLIVVIAGGFALIPVWEAHGAAWAAAIADVFVVTAAYVLLRRAGPGRELRLTFVPRLVLAAGLALAVVLIPGLPPLADAVLAALVFAGAAFALRLVPAGLSELLPGRGAAA